MFEAPINVREEAYFHKKMHNYFLAQRMENSVSNYQIDQIVNGVGFRPKAKKKDALNP